MKINIHTTARWKAPVLKARHWLIAAGLAFAAAGPASAYDLLDMATEFMARRNPAGAFELLAPEESKRAGDPRFDYLLGVSALDSGHVTRAIFALERAVAVRPDDSLARAELGRAYLAAGESDNARSALKQARSAGIPQDAAAAIDRVLGALDQATASRGPKLASYVEFGIGRDSNVNSANNAGEFAIPAFGGLLFTVAPNARQQHDSFATLAAGASLQLALAPNWSLIAAANGRGTDNRQVHVMNTRLVDATLGVSHAAGANVQTIALQSNGAWVSGSVYRVANGISAQWQSQLSATTQWSAFTQWSRQEYSGQAERNTDRSVIGTALAHDFASTGTLVYGSAYFANEHARHDGFDYYGHRAVGSRLGAEQKLVPTATLFAEWQHEHRRYGGAEPLFDMRRRDRQDDLLAGVRWSPASAPTWSVVPAIRRTRARSDVLLYDYGRTVVQISLRKEFQ